MPSQERPPQERETLLFDNPEAANTFRERVERRTTAEERPGVKNRREVVADEVANEFQKQGESATSLHQPWEHTPAEHEEVQDLVNVTFSQDLKAALTKARRSSNYPRNVDLLHDVLTSEMYQLMQQQEINKQSLSGWFMGVLVTVLIVLLGILLLFLL
ncbi:MAG: hypothetical protein HYR90_00105 [Candidatus Andersenbacteria bacterium]|nr:hypothetical protein [Candidatus Andersenbacteria bacterium]MBI3251131.1 hypothetical protein [Candidatus Andersenbacteria bacterium]